ncbi:MAG TPA: leucyl aminopeptidase, partial [Candidatus Bathyarchaeia archaeon]|nr:leucyl aminopeptidase [Candidatus Bathyarchaeia archaeon]
FGTLKYRVNTASEKALCMITIALSTKKLSELKEASYGYILEENADAKHLKHVESLYPAIADVFAQREFRGGKNDTLTLTIPSQEGAAYIFLAGVGKKNAQNSIALEQYRRAVARIVKAAITHRCSSLAIVVPAASAYEANVQELAYETVVIAYMTAYHYDDFITDKSRKQIQELKITLCVDAKNKAAAQNGIKEGVIMGTSVNKARHWIDSPANVLTPHYLAEQARVIAKKQDLEITVFDEATINKMGMGGLAAVSRGSDLDCCLIVMEYKAKKKNAPTIAFVGKGITFDSGGLSIKPAAAMEYMKEDMSGAAAVIAAMEVIAQFEPDVNVIGLAPVAENLPSGKATRPGDIIRFYNGKTAEVKNTDAEGRLILADALSYAVKEYKPDAIVDVATLTGACAYALGPFYCGLFSLHDDLSKKVLNSAQHSGDYAWRLPMGDDYKRAVIADVADLSNTGDAKIMAGSITAAHFLQHFVDEVPWVHLDIAGTAYNVPNIPYFRPGATGFGVRLLVDLACNW